ncbi:MAG: hypothetical protein AUK64_1510 [bacterium P201]|nr:MAG: hypothetical protein AUK64_1510 [bacterium P201]
MKNILRTGFLMVAVAALAALLLAGCQEASRKKDPSLKEKVEQTEIESDSLKEDSLKAFYERMRRWDALHGGMRHRESDK